MCGFQPTKPPQPFADGPISEPSKRQSRIVARQAVESLMTPMKPPHDASPDSISVIATETRHRSITVAVSALARPTSPAANLSSDTIEPVTRRSWILAAWTDANGAAHWVSVKIQFTESSLPPPLKSPRKGRSSVPTRGAAGPSETSATSVAFNVPSPAFTRLAKFAQSAALAIWTVSAFAETAQIAMTSAAARRMKGGGVAAE